MKVQGSIYYMYMFDVGGDIDLARTETLLKKKAEAAEFSYTKITPRHMRLAPVPLQSELKKRKIADREYSVTTRMYSLGVVSVIFRTDVETELDRLPELAEPPLSQHASEIAEKTIREIDDSIIRKYERDKVPEEYTVFVVKKQEKRIGGEEFLSKYKREIAVLLRDEKDPSVLSDREVDIAVRNPVVYYKDDLTAVGWAGAFLLEPSDESDAVLTLELANIQLLELRTYDRLLDRLIDKAYADLKTVLYPTALRLFVPHKLYSTAKEISEMRLEMADVLENIMNISKLVGDWYIARVYSYANERLHVNHWQDSVSRKLDYLEDFYAVAVDRITAFRNLALEALIVFLIVFEIVMAFLRVG